MKMVVNTKIKKKKFKNKYSNTNNGQKVFYLHPLQQIKSGFKYFPFEELSSSFNICL